MCAFNKTEKGKLAKCFRGVSREITGHVFSIKDCTKKKHQQSKSGEVFLFMVDFVFVWFVCFHYIMKTMDTVISCSDKGYRFLH